MGVERAEGWELGRRVGVWQRVGGGLRSAPSQSQAFCCPELLLLPSRRNCGISLPGMMLFSDAGTGLALSFVSRGSGEREVPELQRLPPSVKLWGA